LAARVLRPRASLDHLVGEREQLLWNRDAKGLRGFKVDDQLKFRRLLNR